MPISADLSICSSFVHPVGRRPVDAVPFEANSQLENIGCNIMLCITPEGAEQGDGSWTVRQAKKAAEVGAVAIIFASSSDDELFAMTTTTKYKSEIPILMIKSSDATRMREHGGALIRGRGTGRGLGCCGRSWIV